MGNKSSKSLCFKETNNSFSIYPPIIDDKKFGKSCVNFAYLDLNISETSETNVGQIVKYELFRDYDDFRVKTAICSGKPRKKYSSFLNPKSHWYNSLISVIKIEAEWETRPFGFTENLEINKEDIYLLSKAIWNYLVHYIYGVPISECIKYNKIENEDTMMISRNLKIDNHDYIELEINNLRVVGGYSSLVSGGKNNYNINDNELTPLWRTIFGNIKPKKQITGMFNYVDMKLKVYLRYENTNNTFFTYIYIVSINDEKLYDFLSLQEESIKKIITHFE